MIFSQKSVIKKNMGFQKKYGVFKKSMGFWGRKKKVWGFWVLGFGEAEKKYGVFRRSRKKYGVFQPPEKKYEVFKSKFLMFLD